AGAFVERQLVALDDEGNAVAFAGLDQAGLRIPAPAPVKRPLGEHRAGGQQCREGNRGAKDQACFSKTEMKKPSVSVRNGVRTRPPSVFSAASASASEA